MIIARISHQKDLIGVTLKKLLIFAFLLGLLLPSFAVAPKKMNTTDLPVYAPDLVKVKLSSAVVSLADLPEDIFIELSSTQYPALDALLQELGARSISRAHRRVKDAAWESKEGFDRWFLLHLDGRMNPLEAIELLRGNPLIELAIPERYAYTQLTPNDTHYAANWGHNNTGQGSGGGGAGFDSNAPEAWDQEQGFGTPDIIIAIIDSGVNYNHVDLAENCVQGHDYGSNDTNPMDSNGHGTSCAGVAAGRTNNGIGVAGVAGGCSIMPIKVMNSSGNMTFTSISNGVTHAADNGAHVLSLSLGAESGTQEGSDPATDAAFHYAYNSGAVIFAATANSNASAIAYPANHSAVISVGAASPTGQRKSTSSSDGQSWWGSNYGVNIQDDPKAVDIMAATILPATSVNGGYSMDFNGTSCSTPYVAGVAGLLLSKDPGLTPAEVRIAITSTATDMTIDGGIGWDRYTGYGMVNADAALNSVGGGAPYVQITSPASNAVIELGSIVQISATATDADGIVVSVQFFIDDSDTPIYTGYSAPYEWAWNTSGYEPWAHSIRALATDDEGNTRQNSINVFLLAPASDGFETGDFDAYPYTHSGNSPWVITSTEAYSGIFAAKAGTITHNQTSTLSLELEVSEPGQISFFSKVSSEVNYDYLRFYIDGTLQEQWSGTSDWTLRSFSVQSGLRTFSWTYFKDQGVSSGSDTAWLDHIVLPQHGTAPTAPSNLIATALSPTRIGLSWTDNSSNETEFHIESLNGSTWQLIDWTPANVNSAVLTGLMPDTAYSFRVKAVNDTEAGPYSNTAVATTLGSDSPEDPLAESAQNAVALSWVAPGSGSDGYLIWRHRVQNGIIADGELITPQAILETSFTDQQWYMQEAGEYVWKIASVFSTVQSAASITNSLVKVHNGIINGVVRDLAGSPISEALVSIGSVESFTNASGAYVLSLLPGNYLLVASHPEYLSVEVDRVSVFSQVYTSQDFALPVDVVEAPFFSPEPGEYSGEVQISLSCQTPDAAIYYTMDGTDPDENSALFTSVFTISSSCIIKARAFNSLYIPSPITYAAYEISTSNPDDGLVVKPGIHSIYPNPFSRGTNIRFGTKANEPAYDLKIYNLRGEVVYKTQGTSKGVQELFWEAKDLRGRRAAAGIYFLELRSGDLRQTRKLIVF